MPTISTYIAHLGAYISRKQNLYFGAKLFLLGPKNSHLGPKFMFLKILML